MITGKEIKAMPLDEKLRIMEAIWADISSSPDDLHSPDWHRKELEETERRRKAGLEAPIGWEEAKRHLIERRNED